MVLVALGNPPYNASNNASYAHRHYLMTMQRLTRDFSISFGGPVHQRFMLLQLYVMLEAV